MALSCSDEEVSSVDAPAEAADEDMVDVKVEGEDEKKQDDEEQANDEESGEEEAKKEQDKENDAGEANAGSGVASAAAAVAAGATAAALASGLLTAPKGRYINKLELPSFLSRKRFRPKNPDLAKELGYLFQSLSKGAFDTDGVVSGIMRAFELTKSPFLSLAVEKAIKNFLESVRTRATTQLNSEVARKRKGYDCKDRQQQHRETPGRD